MFNYYDKKEVNILEYDAFKVVLRSKFVNGKMAVIACNKCNYRYSCSLSCLTQENFVEHAFERYSTPCRCGENNYQIQTGW